MNVLFQSYENAMRPEKVVTESTTLNDFIEKQDLTLSSCKIGADGFALGEKIYVDEEGSVPQNLILSGSTGECYVKDIKLKEDSRIILIKESYKSGN